ncbi:hypothetical protein GCM10022419_054790 [Nonomuraea rosea]|uniref:Uncharacterized protein n=1 Tax=Nonomuraea rosea TaxID=638574 RepID=A0ABP6XMP8_9ACTN
MGRVKSAAICNVAEATCQGQFVSQPWIGADRAVSCPKLSEIWDATPAAPEARRTGYRIAPFPAVRERPPENSHYREILTHMVNRRRNRLSQGGHAGGTGG